MIQAQLLIKHIMIIYNLYIFDNHIFTTTKNRNDDLPIHCNSHLDPWRNVL